MVSGGITIAKCKECGVGIGFFPSDVYCKECREKIEELKEKEGLEKVEKENNEKMIRNRRTFTESILNKECGEYVYRNCSVCLETNNFKSPTCKDCFVWKKEICGSCKYYSSDGFCKRYPEKKK